MKKFLLSLAAFALVSSSAMADDLLYDLGFGSDVNVDLKYYPKNSSYTGNFTYKLTNTETFTVSNFNNNNNSWSDMIKCGRKGNASTGYITTDFAISDNLTSVILSIPTWTTDKVNSITLQSSSDGSTWADVVSHNQSYDDATAKTVTLKVPTPAANLYYRIAFDCASASSNGPLCLSNVKYYGTKSGVPSKTPAGISFAANEMYAIAKAPAEAVALDNPNGLTVTYSSSDESVVSVDAATGAIMVKAVGTAVISATTPETDEYAEGKASYTVNVVNKANNGSQLIMYSQESGDKVAMAGYMTVAYANGAYIYVRDYLDNPALFYAFNTTYKVGDMLAPTYFLEYAPYYGLPEWKFISELPGLFGTEKVEYTSYSSVSKDNLNEICYLTDVTFDAATPTAKSQNFTGTLSDGSTLAFRTQWTLEESVEPGKYNVLGAVGFYKDKNGVETLQFFPISYEAVTEPVVFPSSFTVTSDATESFSYTYTPAEENEFEINEIVATAETTADNVVLTFDVPEGWTGFMHSPIGDDSGIGGLQLRAQAIQWVPVSSMEEGGYIAENAITIPADGAKYEVQLFLVKDDKADSTDPIFLTVTATKKAAPAEPVIPETISGTCDVQDAEIKSTTAETDPFYIPTLYVTAATDQEAATITLEVPEGWTSFLVYDAENAGGEGGIDPLAEENEESPWVPVSDMLQQGLVETTTISVPADGEEHTYPAYLVAGDRVNTAAQFNISATVTKSSTDGVEGIKASEADAIYYNLQGVQVANPANGVFVKVANGKAVKVVL